MSGNLDADRRAFITGGLSTQRSVERNQDRMERARLDDSIQKRSHLESYSKSAMACCFELLFNMHQYRQAAAASISAFEMIDEFENQLSVYREESEISWVNRMAADRACQVNSRVFDLLLMARDLHQQTAGAFDITCGPFWEIWGFKRRQGRIPDASEIAHAATRTGMQHVELDVGNSEVRFHRNHLQLNFGGIGKGFAVDHVTRLLRGQDIEDFVLHAGQSSVSASGSCQSIDPGDSRRPGWKVGLSHPTNPDCRLAEIDLVNSALATSGTQRQGFFHQGRRFGHIIDPRTGYPSDHFLSSTVVCQSAARADALATALFVMSLDDVQAFCDANPEVQAVIVRPGTDQAGVAVETFNVDQEKWRLL
jgi:thiamine biosynthesis lipoprotein